MSDPRLRALERDPESQERADWEAMRAGLVGLCGGVYPGSVSCGRPAVMRVGIMRLVSGDVLESRPRCTECAAHDIQLDTERSTLVPFVYMGDAHD